MKTKPWTTRPISPVCEHIEGKMAMLSKDEIDPACMCGNPTDFAYPAMGGGWMALCRAHGIKHLPHIETIDALILKGETFEFVNPTDL